MKLKSLAGFSAVLLLMGLTVTSVPADIITDAVSEVPVGVIENAGLGAVTFNELNDDTSVLTDVGWAFGQPSSGPLTGDLKALSSSVERSGDSLLGQTVNPEVPVPAAVLLFGSGLLGFAALRKKLRVGATDTKTR